MFSPLLSNISALATRRQVLFAYLLSSHFCSCVFLPTNLATLGEIGITSNTWLLLALHWVFRLWVSRHFARCAGSSLM